MPTMRLVPELLTKDAALSVLSAFRNGFENGDILEGQVTITEAEDAGTYEVGARLHQSDDRMVIVESMLEIPS